MILSTRTKRVMPPRNNRTFLTNVLMQNIAFWRFLRTVSLASAVELLGTFRFLDNGLLFLHPGSCNTRDVCFIILFSHPFYFMGLICHSFALGSICTNKWSCKRQITLVNLRFPFDQCRVRFVRPWDLSDRKPESGSTWRTSRCVYEILQVMRNVSKSFELI